MDFNPCFFCVIRLRRRGVKFVRAGSVVAFELIIDLGGRIEDLFQKIRADQRRGTESFVKTPNIFGNIDVSVGIVEFLVDTVVAEYGTQIVFGTRLQRRGIQKRRMWIFHKRLYVVPLFGHLVFGQIDLVRDVGVFHGFVLLFHYFFAPFRKKGKNKHGQIRLGRINRVATQFHRAFRRSLRTGTVIPSFCNVKATSDTT